MTNQIKILITPLHLREVHHIRLLILILIINLLLHRFRVFLHQILFNELLQNIIPIHLQILHRLLTLIQQIVLPRMCCQHFAHPLLYVVEFFLIKVQLFVCLFGVLCHAVDFLFGFLLVAILVPEGVTAIVVF